MNIQGGKNQERTKPSLSPVTVNQVATNQTALNQSTRPQFDTTIYPSRVRLNLPYKEIWDSAELLYFLMWRDLKVRYKQAVIGLGWAVIKPLMLMVVFVVVFGIIAHVPTGNMPYSVVVYTGFKVDPIDKTEK